MAEIINKSRRAAVIGAGAMVGLVAEGTNAALTAGEVPAVPPPVPADLAAKLRSDNGADLIGWQGSTLSMWLGLRTLASEGRFAGGVVVGNPNKAAHNTAAINAASHYLYAAGGGVLEFPSGVIYIDGTLTTYSRVEWQGVSSAGTVLRQMNAASPLVQSFEFNALTRSGSRSGSHRCAIRRMTLEGTLDSSGHPVGATTQHGIQLYGYGFSLEDDLHVRNFGGFGITTEWRTPGPSPDSGYSDGFVEARYDRLKVYNCGRSGMKIDGPHDAQWSRVICFNNNLKDPDPVRPNVWVTAQGNPQYIDQLHAWGASSGIALLAEGAVKLTNPALEGASIAQLRIATGECEIHGGELFAPSGSRSKGIEFVGGPSVCIGYKIDTVIRQCNGGSIDFGQGIESAVVDVRIFQIAGQVMLGAVPTAGVGKSLKVAIGGGAENRKSIHREYSVTSTNFSTTDLHGNGVEYAGHGGEGVIALPQRKTEPSASYAPPSGVVLCGREDSIKVWQQGGHIGALMGEQQSAGAPQEALSFENCQLVTLSAIAADVTIKNFKDGLVGVPIFLLLPQGGGEILLATTGNIRSKTGGNISRTSLGANRMLCFVKAKDGYYYQV